MVSISLSNIFFIILSLLIAFDCDLVLDENSLVEKFRNGDFDSSKGTHKNFAFGIAKFVRLEALKKQIQYTLIDDEIDINAIELQTNLPNSTNPIAHLRWAIGQLKEIEQELILFMIDEDARITSPSFMRLRNHVRSWTEPKPSPRLFEDLRSLKNEALVIRAGQLQN